MLFDIFLECIYSYGDTLKLILKKPNQNQPKAFVNQCLSEVSR